MNTLIYCKVFFFLLTTVLATASAFLTDLSASPDRRAKFNWNDTRYVYAFGDSYTFVGGTRGHPNFSFIGDAFNLSFTPHQLLTNEIIYKNTSSDGANWVEFLTGCFSGQPSNCARHQLWDFAFAGSDIDSNLLPLHHNFTVPLTHQVQQWIQHAAHVLPHPSRNTLTAWWIGINDTGDSLKNTTIPDFGAFWDREMRSYFAAVESAYAAGLQGTHLFLTVPPGERAPAHVSDTTFAPVLKQHIALYNTALASHASHFASTHPAARVLAFDANSWFNSILDDAAAHGFTNTTGWCQPFCGNDTYFWFDTGHPTERVHQLLAAAIEAELRHISN